MKKQLKRRVIILLTTFLFVIGISAFLNKASFDPNFSVVDAVTGATKRSHHNSKDTLVKNGVKSVVVADMPAIGAGTVRDGRRRNSYKGLYAAGECACQYHGANSLGGNSLLGALYGGKTAARSAMTDDFDIPGDVKLQKENPVTKTIEGSYMDGMLELRRILRNGLGIVRDGKAIEQSLLEFNDLREKISESYDPTASVYENESLRNCCMLGQALLLSADSRKESRGAYTRSDFPEERCEYQKQTVARLCDMKIQITFESAGGENED